MKWNIRQRFASSAVAVLTREHVSKRGKTYKRKSKRFPVKSKGDK